MWSQHRQYECNAIRCLQALGIRETVKTVSPRLTPPHTRLKPGANEKLPSPMHGRIGTGRNPGANERKSPVAPSRIVSWLNPRADAVALLRGVLFRFCIIAQ